MKQERYKQQNEMEILVVNGRPKLRAEKKQIFFDKESLVNVGLTILSFSTKYAIIINNIIRVGL